MDQEKALWAVGPKLEFDLREIISVLFRYKKAGLRTFWGSLMLLSIAVVFLGRRYYTAEMAVLVNQSRAEPLITSGPSAPAALHAISTDQVASELDLLKGRDMMEVVADRCGLVNDLPSWRDFMHTKDPVLRHAEKREYAAEELARKIVAKAGVTSDVISIKYSVIGEPKEPACVLKNLAQLYVEKHLRLQRPEGSLAFFAQQTEEYRKALSQSEANLIALSQQEQIASPDVLKVDLAQQLAQSESSLNDAIQQLSVARTRKVNLRRQLDSTPQRTPTAQTTSAADRMEQDLVSALIAAQGRRSQLATKYTDTYPLVREADAEVTQIQEALLRAKTTQYVNTTTDRDTTYEFLRQELAKTDENLVSQNALVAALRRSIDSLRHQMVHLDELAIRQNALQRDLRANENSYLFYLGKREQERTSDALDRNGIVNVSIAVPPTVPLIPTYGTTRMLLLALLTSAFIGVFTICLYQYFDPSIRTPQELQRTLGLAILAALPYPE